MARGPALCPIAAEAGTLLALRRHGGGDAQPQLSNGAGVLVMPVKPFETADRISDLIGNAVYAEMQRGSRLLEALAGQACALLGHMRSAPLEDALDEFIELGAALERLLSSLASYLAGSSVESPLHGDQNQAREQGQAASEAGSSAGREDPGGQTGGSASE
jgi:hypothetical protein